MPSVVDGGETNEKNTSISEWAFTVVPSLPKTVIDPEEVKHPVVTGEFGFTLAYAPDYVGADIERRFYVELQESGGSLPKLKIGTSDSIAYLDRNADIYFIDEYQPGMNQRIIGKPLDITTDMGLKFTVVKSRTGARRYYFKTEHVDHDATITFINPETQGKMVVFLKIYDMHDMARPHIILDQDTTLIGGGAGQEVVIPQIFPIGMGGDVLPYTKQKGRYAKPTRAANKGQTHLLEYSAEDIWEGMPDSSARLSTSASFVKPNLEPLRYMGITEGAVSEHSKDPLHGYRYYVDEEGTRIPSNDIENDDFSSGVFPDDGFVPVRYNHARMPLAQNRWASLTPKNQIRPLGILTFERERQQARLAERYADQYQKTGNPEYAYRGLLLLSRIGLEMNFRSFMQHYRTKGDQDEIRKRLSTNTVMRRLSLSVLFGVGLGESRTIFPLIAAYEKLFPALDDTSGNLVAFLKNKGLPIEDTRDVKWLIERIYLSWVQANIHRQSCFNFPASHVLVTQVIDLLGYPDDQLLDILCDGHPGTHYPISSARHLLNAEFTKDGIKSENIGGYNTGAVNGVGEVLLSIEDVAGDSGKKPNYDRLHNALLSNVHLALVPSRRARAKWGMADTMFSYEGMLGSSYRIDGWEGRDPFPWYYGDVYGENSDTMFLKAFSLRPDPRIAWAFLNSGPFGELATKQNSSGRVVWQSRDYEFTWDDLRAAAETLPGDWRTGVFPITALNLNILRRGKGFYERSCTIGVGATGRSLYDQMELKLFGFRNHLITRSDVSAGIVENAGRQYVTDGTDLIGKAVLHSNGDYFALIDHEVSRFQRKAKIDDTFQEPTASSYHVLPDEGWQRRINALVDIDEKHFYLIDLYRMREGEDHWRLLSLLPKAETTFEGLEFSAGNTSLRGGDISVLPTYGSGIVDFTGAKRADGRDGWIAASQTTGMDGLSMRLHSLFDGQSQIYVGYPELRGSGVKETQKVLGQEMILWNHKRQGTENQPYLSQLLNVMEFYGGNTSAPQIRSTQYLKVDGKDEFGFRPLGCEIELPDRTDYFIFSASQHAKEMRLPNGHIMGLKGRVAHAAFSRDNELVHLEIIGGTHLTCAGETIHSAPELRGEIASADARRNRIVVAAESRIPDFVSDDYLKKKEINLRRGSFEQTYQIDEAKISDDRMRIEMRLHLPVVSIRSEITDIKPDRLELESPYLDWNMSIHGSRVRGASGRMYVADGKGQPGSADLIFFGKAQTHQFARSTLGEEFLVGESIDLYDYWIGDKIRVPINRCLNEFR